MDVFAALKRFRRELKERAEPLPAPPLEALQPTQFSTATFALG